MNEWHNAEYHAERAHQFYEAGQWDKALDELKLALAVNPNQSDWHFGMGLTLEAMHRYDEAIASFEHVLRIRGQDTEAMFHLGVALLRSGRCQRAIGALAQVSEDDPDYEPSYCYRIAAYTQLGDHDMAEQMFYLAQQINEDCPQCYDHVALSLALRGDLDRAIWCWHRVLKIDPHYPDVYANLARAHWQRGQLDRASQLFTLQLRQDPGDVETLLQQGNLLVELGRHTKAREKFNRVLEQDPVATEAYLHLGELSLIAGQLEAATAELEMARRLAPDHPGVHLCLARVAQHRGDDQLVKRHLSAELERSGQTVPQALQLGQMLMERHRPQDAVRVLSPVIEAMVDTPRPNKEQLAAALLCRGMAWVAEGKTQEGIAQYHRCIRLTPRNTAAMAQLVVAYLQTCQRRRAYYWWRRATTLRPGDPQLRRLRFRVMCAYWVDPARRTLAKWVRWRPSRRFSG